MTTRLDTKICPTHMGDWRSAGDDETRFGISVKSRASVKRPSMYRVLLLNDDYTPMDFVIEVLQRFFHKTTEEATEIMLKVHNDGVGVCGVYTFEVAETKAGQVVDLARRSQHPLQCTIEKE